MFTGIVEEIGIVKKILDIPMGKRIFIKSKNILKDISKGDSVNINGICQTVTYIFQDVFSVEAVGKTLKNTTMRNFKPGIKVNLERAIKAGNRFGGHIVLGHVNGIGKIHSIRNLGKYRHVEIAIPPALEKYVVEEGSIAIDGISLTIASCAGDMVCVNIIPYTFNTTTLQFKKNGDRVNIEVDILSKYLEKIIFNNKQNENKKIILENWG